jgi:hypothetical protein
MLLSTEDLKYYDVSTSIFQLCPREVLATSSSASALHGGSVLHETCFRVSVSHLHFSCVHLRN